LTELERDYRNMAMKRTKSDKRPIEQYSHADKKRANNPPVGLVTPDTDETETKRTYAYDPHLDPSLQWAGKAERTSFDVPTVSPLWPSHSRHFEQYPGRV